MKKISKEKFEKIRATIPKRITFDLDDFKKFINNLDQKQGGNFTFDDHDQQLIYKIFIQTKTEEIFDYMTVKFEIYNG